VSGISADKDKNVGGNLQINYAPEIKNVESVSVSAFDEEIARIDFRFKVDYTENGESQANIEIVGDVLWNGDTENIVETWEERQNLPERIQAPLMNDLYRKMLSEAVGIADTLKMLPPIPTPQVEQKKQQ
jgi:hypothetical protein